MQSKILFTVLTVGLSGVQAYQQPNYYALNRRSGYAAQDNVLQDLMSRSIIEDEDDFEMNLMIRELVHEALLAREEPALFKRVQCVCGSTTHSLDNITKKCPLNKDDKSKPPPQNSLTCSTCGEKFSTTVGLSNHRRASGHKDLQW